MWRCIQIVARILQLVYQRAQSLVGTGRNGLCSPGRQARRTPILCAEQPPKSIQEADSMDQNLDARGGGLCSSFQGSRFRVQLQIVAPFSIRLPLFLLPAAPFSEPNRTIPRYNFLALPEIV